MEILKAAQNQFDISEGTFIDKFDFGEEDFLGKMHVEEQDHVLLDLIYNVYPQESEEIDVYPVCSKNVNHILRRKGGLKASQKSLDISRDNVG